VPSELGRPTSSSPASTRASTPTRRGDRDVAEVRRGLLDRRDARLRPASSWSSRRASSTTSTLTAGAHAALSFFPTTEILSTFQQEIPGRWQRVELEASRTDPTELDPDNLPEDFPSPRGARDGEARQGGN
jgi:hypothetical protein